MTHDYLSCCRPSGKNHCKKIFFLLAGIAGLLLSVAHRTTASAEIVPSTISYLDGVYAEQSESGTLSLVASHSAVATETISIPFKGVLQLSAKVESTTSNIQLQLFTDAACTVPVNNTTINLSASKTSDSAYFSFRETGTFYLKASYTLLDETSTAPNTVSVSAAMIPGDDDELYAKDTCLYYTADDEVMVYHKIKLKKPGLVTVKGKAYYITTKNKTDMNITLYDKNKQAISEECKLYSANSYTNYYALEKGTYYIGVAEYNLYTLRYSFQPITATTAGQNQKKAATIPTDGSEIKNLLPSGTSSATGHWYKFKVKKTGHLLVTMAASGADKSYCSIKIYRSDKSKLITVTDDVAVKHNAKKATKILKNKKLTAGTYYIVVEKPEDTSSTGYTMTATLLP